MGDPRVVTLLSRRVRHQGRRLPQDATRPSPGGRSPRPARRRRLMSAGGVLGTLLVGFLLWPSPIDAVAYRPAPAPPLAGSWAQNDRLSEAEILFEDRLDRPEHVAVDRSGRVYTGTADGVVHRIVDAAGDDPRLESFARVPGRPLRMAFAPDGDLVVAAGDGGLVAVDPDGRVRTLAPTAANSVAVAADGTMYVTEAATRPDRNFPLGMLEQRPYGRVLVLRPGSTQPEVLLDGLVFANGVALTADETAVLVVESFRYRILRHWVAGPRAGRTETWAENLPGVPDNVITDGCGQVWLGVSAPRVRLVDEILHPRPRVKDQVAKVASALRAIGSATGGGFVAVFDEAGRPLQSFHDPDGRYTGVSAAVPDSDTLFVGSLFDTGLARLDMTGLDMTGLDVTGLDSPGPECPTSVRSGA